MSPFLGPQPWEAPDPLPVMRRELKLLLIEMNLLRIGDANTAAPEKVRALREVTRARGVEVAIHLAERPEQIVPEIEKASRAGAEALNVLASPILCATPRHLRAYGCDPRVLSKMGKDAFRSPRT